jgi:hypothetical protein
MKLKTNNMKNLTQSIELQLEKLNAIKILLKYVETDNNHQSTGGMLKALKESIEELIESDF